MAKAFQEWCVLPHTPIEKLSDTVWTVEGTMPDGRTKRRMTMIRLADGKLIIHNAIALEEELMAEVTAFGAPAAILVPNGFHRQDAKIMKDRFPGAKVYCPRAAKKAVSQVVPVDGSYAEAPQDATVRIRHLDGLNEKEGVVEATSSDGRSLIFNDLLLNMKKAPFFARFFLAPLGRLSVPRFSRVLLVKDKRALRADLERLATPDLRRVIPGHGALVLENAAASLKAAAAEL